MYENMQDSSITYEAAASIVEDLKSDYGTTPYAATASLLMAKKAVENGALSEAASQLQWVLSNTEDTGLQHIARIRLAMVRLAEGDADATLRLVKDFAREGGEPEFVSRYYEIQGDALAENGDVDAARESYTQAQALLPGGASNSSLLKLKLDNLGNF